MTMTDRRTFLQSMAAAGMSTILPKSIQKALAIEPNVVTGKIDDVQHIVILMQENRSFDHYFGTLRGVRGFQDPRAVRLYGTNNSVFEQPNQNSQGVTQNPPTLWPFRPVANDLGLAFIGDLPHAWRDAHQCWNNGRYDIPEAQRHPVLLRAGGLVHRLRRVFHVGDDVDGPQSVLSLDGLVRAEWNGLSRQPRHRTHRLRSVHCVQRQRHTPGRPGGHQCRGGLQLAHLSRAAARCGRHLEDLSGHRCGSQRGRRVGMDRRAAVYRQLRLQLAALLPAISEFTAGLAAVRSLAAGHADLQRHDVRQRHAVRSVAR